MKVRRVRDLAQASDSDFLEAIGEGSLLCLKNAEQLFEEAAAAHDAGGARGYHVLRNAAAEEASKVLILLDAARCPPTKHSERGRQLGKFTDHLARMIYSELADSHPKDFGELSKLVENLRQEYYLDGPNGFDWIYRNRLLSEREGWMYVDYVETDEGRRWESPNDTFAKMLASGPPVVPGSLRIARHMATVGLLSDAGVRITADVWRHFEPEAATRWATLRMKNLETLERLARIGQLFDTEPASVHAVAENWPFPLWGLDMALVKISYEEKLAASRALALKYPEGY